ncbi:hypothetical protein GCM10028778_18140 [Barrientosiimonas marina]
MAIADDAFWDRVKSKLTANQWKWVQYHIIEDMRLPEIARQEGVSAEAVKSWGREARRSGSANRKKQRKRCVTRLLAKYRSG